MGPRNNEKDLKCLFDFEFNWIDGFSFLAQFTSLKLSRSLSSSSPVKLSLCLKYVHWFKICFTSTMLRRLSIVKTSLSDEFVTRPWRFGPGDDFDGAKVESDVDEEKPEPEVDLLKARQEEEDKLSEEEREVKHSTRSLSWVKLMGFFLISPRKRDFYKKGLKQRSFGLN